MAVAIGRTCVPKIRSCLPTMAKSRGFMINCEPVEIATTLVYIDTSCTWNSRTFFVVSIGAIINLRGEGDVAIAIGRLIERRARAEY
jgi:hypothetical protein